MAHGVSVIGPYAVGDDTSITTAISAAALVADDITSWVSDRQVWFAIVTA